MRASLVSIIEALVVVAFAGTAYGGNHHFKNADFKAELSGASEVPPVVTDTTGEAKFIVIDNENALRFELEIEDAVAILGAAGAHIHCASVGVNGPIAVFLAGVQTGGYSGKIEIKGTVDATNMNVTTCGATISELIEAMEAGDTYVNVHSPDFPGGEIRGQIEAVN